LYLLIVGVIVVARRRSIMPTVTELVTNRPVLLVLGLVEILAGLAVILVSPQAGFSAEGIVAIIGWVLLIEGCIYLAMPMKAVQKFVKSFNKQEWYMGGGFIAALIGAYLAGSGFGMF
jgi:uncharacterized membrane protein